MSENWKSYIRLCAIPDIGAVTAMRLIDAFGTPEAVLSASKESLMQVDKIGEKTASSIVDNRDLINVEKICARMNQLGARYIDFNDSAYPKMLRQISDMPIGFYSIGDCDFNAPCVSIVGSRNCTAYGQIVARKFAMAFTRAGITVVSGMARGIDSAAHFGAIEAGGKTIAVLGCGADIIYPSENIDLYKKIIEHGAIVSEFPLGTRADRQTFPIRNRIVAGMSLATIVVESDVRGGSLITARLAGEQGRDVFAVPGRIDSDSSKGCNALIRDGATLASCPEDIIDSLSFSGQLEISLDDNLEASTNKKTVVKNHTETKKESCDAINLQGNEAKIYSAIAKSQEISADEISEKSGLPVSTCLSTLLMLEIKRLIVKNAGGSWSRRC